jgi:hypothetical protein
MGLISVSPESIDYQDGKLVFTADPKWHPIEEDMDNFYCLIKEISNVLNGELPPISSTCGLCIYRSRFETKTKISDDSPF